VILAHGINYSTDSDIIEIAELSLLLGERVVVTLHSSPIISIQNLKDELVSTLDPVHSPSALTYLILDRFVSNIRPAVDHMTDVMDELEEAAISKPIPAVLEGVLRLKRSALRINRAMQRQIEVLHLLKSFFAQRDENLGHAFQELAEKAIRTFEINSVIRERADSALAIYQGSVSLKQNETMKALAIIAAIFLPLSLVAGIYGMNFVYIPELEHRWGYHAILVSMAVFGILVTWWVWLRPKISIWRFGTRGLYSMKVPIHLVNQGVRGVGTISKLRGKAEK
jgi:magnesium transporter